MNKKASQSFRLILPEVSSLKKSKYKKFKRPRIVPTTSRAFIY
jgi:hypothetical protein